MDQFVLAVAQFIERFPFVPVFALVGVFGGLAMLAASRPRTRRCYVAWTTTLGLLGFFGASLAVMKSGPGRWATAMRRDTVAAYNKMLIEVPDSRYREKAIARVRSLQYAALDKDDTSVAMYLLCAMSMQEAPPHRLHLFIEGNRQYHGNDDRANVARYDRLLDRFERDLSEMIEELVAPFGPVIIAGVRPPPDRPAPIVVLSYLARWDGAFVQYTYPPYHFDAISLAVEWAVFPPQSRLAAFWGETDPAYPPSQPHWKSSKYPEEGVGDIVVEETLPQVRAAFTQQRPGAWSCPLAPG